MARLCEDKIAELEALRADLPRSERSGFNMHLHTVRRFLRFAKTRAGYMTMG